MLDGYDMDLRQLRYFVAIAECKSITLAAKQVHIAQPALTRQMHQLEESLGTELIERSTRGIKMTAAGEQLLADVKRVLNDLELARNRAIRAGRGEVGHMAMGIPVMRYLADPVATILRKFRAEAPNVSVSVHHHLSETQLELLAEGRLDAGVTLYRDAADPSFSGIHLYSDPMTFVYPRNWSWPNGLPRSLADLAGLEFIWIARDTAPAWHDELIHCFFKAKFVPKPTVTGIDAASMLAMVHAGLGCTVVPISTTLASQDSVCSLRLPDLDVVHDWELVWRTDNSSAILLRFLSVARSAIHSRSELYE